ncbi:glycosyl hydrolase family 18 protein [Streptomyces sp. NPDC048111]|uniref:glycosyl hydrolase family 18 protein n=1 Tax=Streptomyces sp. NPDC048111 TaxID=3365500 RepID=UPI003723F516
MSAPRSAPTRRRRRLAVLLAALLLPLAALTGLGAAPAAAASGLTATFAPQDNGSWWKGTFVVHNAGSAPVTGWSLEFDLPAGVSITGHYNGDATVTGRHVSVKNAYYNATVPPGGTTEPYSYWFVANGPISAPTGCTVNGDKCDGAPDVPPTAPGKPQATTVTAHSVSLAWTAASAGDHPVASYEVLGGDTVLATTATTSATLMGLTPATGYSFTVRAKDTRGNSGPRSEPLAVSTVDPASDPVPPGAPNDPHATAKTSTSVSLAWGAATDNVGVVAYGVYRDGILATTVGAPATTATVTGLTPSTKYTFTVRARDAADNASPPSAALSVTTDDLVGQGKYLKTGYFAQWGIYGRQYFVKNLDTSGAAAKLDVLNYAFENIDPTNLTCQAGVTKGVTADPEDPDQGTGAGDADADYGRAMTAAQSVDGTADDGWGQLRGNFNQLKKLKAKYPNLKTVVSIGGWTYSKFFSDAAATDASRKKFVSSCIDVWIKGNLPLYNGAGGPGTGAGVFDGIDIDWEWPGTDGHPGNHYSTADKAHLALLLAEFRKQLDALGGPHRLLTAFTPADPVKIAAGWDLTPGGTGVFSSLDYAQVQGYDFHGSGSDNSWEPNRTGQSANLYTDPKDPYPFHFSVDAAIGTYLSAGTNPRKLTVGFPFYGRGWQTVADGGAHGAWQSAGGAAPGQFPDEAGVRGYSNLIASVPGLTVYHDDQTVATYGYTGDGGQWWSFDDAWSISHKTPYIKKQNLLGAFIWEMSGDTPSGTLMNALDTGLK